jgi:HK97 gp10 family phage protein
MATGKIFDLKVQGLDQIVARVEFLSTELEAAAPEALAQGAEIVMAMMRRLAPEDTGKLRRSIRFVIGRGGDARTSVRRSGSFGRTQAVGTILAGDETTLVSGSRGARKGGKAGRRWQNARLQEFGTQKMPAHPYFFPAWRAQKAKARQKIGAILAGAYRKAKRQQPVSTPAQEAA